MLGGRRTAALVLAAAALWQIGEGLYIPLKAVLAQRLIASAWAQSLHGEAAARAWPWADFAPAGRLRVPHRDVDLIVLSDASARTLAFGPGWMTPASWTGGGVGALAGHRDTHFRFVRELIRGDIVELQDVHGRWRRYRIEGLSRFDPANGPLRVACSRECLALVTCDRARSAGGGEPLRLVATAVRADAPYPAASTGAATLH